MAGTRIDTPSTDASVDADTDVEGFIISEDWSVKEYTLGKAQFPKTDHATTPAASGEHISSLKEYGDKFGEAPKYHEVKIQMQPPLFQS